MSRLGADVILLIAAAVWGFAFVAQRVGMSYMGPLAFNAIRFGLGALILLPLVIRESRNSRTKGQLEAMSRRQCIIGMLITGSVLFTGATLQQTGIIYTTAGKAGFITGLYVIIVPVLGIAIGSTTNISTWIGSSLAVIGLYFLSVGPDFTISKGDGIVLLGAIAWAFHVHVIQAYVRRIGPFRLAFAQFAICSLLSAIGAIVFESLTFQDIRYAYIALLYGGLASVGVGYTLQVVGLRRAHPSHASIILSLEAVFAVIGGFLILGENLSTRELGGCVIMLAGMLASQCRLPGRRKT